MDGVRPPEGILYFPLLELLPELLLLPELEGLEELLLLELLPEVLFPVEADAALPLLPVLFSALLPPALPVPHALPEAAAFTIARSVEVAAAFA